MPVGYSTVLMKTRYEHIVSNEDHRIPEVVGTALKVVEQQAHGWSPEELHFQHPYLALGLIHSTLAYYLGPPRGARPGHPAPHRTSRRIAS
jgi:hypothetical protein